MKKELIRKFFRNECSPEEAEQVWKYLKGHPGQLDRYMNYAGWERESGEHPLDPALSERMMREIRKQARVKPVRFRSRKILAIAASVTLFACLCAGWWLYDNARDKQISVKSSTAVPAENRNDFRIVKVNTGQESRTLTLPDGSSVELDTGSRISHYHSFGNKRRDIFLEGKALFEVVRHEQQPFTVYAGNLVTTALGTVFSISAQRCTNETTVRLLSGKVVVKPDSLLKVNGLKQVYLSPGKELTVNSRQFTSSLKYFGEAEPEASRPERKPVLKPGLAEISDTMIVFKQHPLPLVLKDLEALYQVPLHFEESGLRRILFTGEYRRDEESLEQILNSIALLNELNVSAGGEGYHIEAK